MVGEKIPLRMTIDSLGILPWQTAEGPVGWCQQCPKHGHNNFHKYLCQCIDCDNINSVRIEYPGRRSRAGAACQGARERGREEFRALKQVDGKTGPRNPSRPRAMAGRYLAIWLWIFCPWLARVLRAGGRWGARLGVSRWARLKNDRLRGSQKRESRKRGF